MTNGFPKLISSTYNTDYSAATYRIDETTLLVRVWDDERETPGNYTFIGYSDAQRFVEAFLAERRDRRTRRRRRDALAKGYGILGALDSDYDKTLDPPYTVGV